jgi:hypothetical protein
MRAAMKITVNGQVFPKIWGIANSVKKLRTQRRQVNIGGGTVGFPVFEVELPDETRKEGLYLITPQGIRLYYFPGDQYRIGYLISEMDSDPIRDRHFPDSAKKTAS